MSLRERNGKWHYRFKVAGHTWTGNTGLDAIKRNETAALVKEAEAQRQVQEGQGDKLRLEIRTFPDASDLFIEFCKGQYREKPNTWKRLRGSMTALKGFYGSRPLHTINSAGMIADYMTWRRSEEMDVAEVTIRHDIHALSLLFQYGMAHNWCRFNPATSEYLESHGIKMPSDAEAVRIHVLSAAEEKMYFATCLRPAETIKVKSKPHTQIRNGNRVAIGAYEYEKLASRDYQDLHDICRLMILQGPRPFEVMQAHVEHVDLDRGTWYIPRSKSKAGERTLHLTAESCSIFARRMGDPKVTRAAWIFPGKLAGEHIVDVENAHQAVMETSGLALVIYDMRHTFATRFYEATKDVEALRKVLGHANLRTIQKYVHVSQEHVQNAMRVYEASLKPLEQVKEVIQ